MEPGTWTEFGGAIVAGLLGILTAVFAYLAWRQTKAAERWAKIAAEAQQRSTAISEAVVPVHLNARLLRIITPDGIIFGVGLVLECAADSSAVWIQQIKSSGAVFNHFDDNQGEEITRWDHNEADVVPDAGLPFFLRPDPDGVNSIALADPWSEIHPRKVADTSFAYLDVVYSITEDGKHHDYAIQVDLTDIVEPNWLI